MWQHSMNLIKTMKDVDLDVKILKKKHGVMLKTEILSRDIETIK